MHPTHLRASLRSCSAHSLSERCCRSSRMFIVLWKWPQDKLTLTAVSCLSPVSTHTLIPASRRASMVSWTLSWSLQETRERKNIYHVLMLHVLFMHSFQSILYMITLGQSPLHINLKKIKVKSVSMDKSKDTKKG